MTTTTPCVSCGTRGGHIARYMARPWRGRGHCRNCYTREYKRGAFDHNLGLVWGSGRYASAVSHEYVIWHTPQGDRQSCALGFDAEYDRLAVQVAAEQFAANWLSDHPTYVAKYAPLTVAA